MKKSKGFAIITTLMMAVIVVMMITAGLALLPTHRVMTGTLEDNQRAITAAEAGVEYARTQLQANPSWKGDNNAVVINEPGALWVREDEGNVVGIVWSADGEPALFKLRFNFQNEDDNPEEGFDDNPSSAMMVYHKYISYNNLDRASPSGLWRSDESGDYEVDDGTSFGDVPRFTSVIYCQGMAGSGVQDVSPTDLTPDPAKGPVTTRTLEAFIGRSVNQFGDSVVYGANDVTLNAANEILIEDSTQGGAPRMRTLQDVVTNTNTGAPDFDMQNGEVFVNQTTGAFTINGATSTNPAATQADSSGSFLEIGYNEINTASAGDAQMNAGMYVWEYIGGKEELVYYDLEYTPGDPLRDPFALGSTLLGTGTVINSESDLGPSIGGSDIDIKRSKLELAVKKNIEVATTANASGVAILVDPTVVIGEKRRPQLEFRPKKNDPTPIVSTAGQFTMAGKVHGSGGVTSEGDITLQGESVLHSRVDTQVALYSKGDVTIEPIDFNMVNFINGSGGGGGNNAGSGSGSGGGGSGSSIFLEGINPFLASLSSGDVAFSGVIYAQGDFNANNPGYNFHLRGTLVAFGGDTELGESPGTRPNKGAVNINADNVQFIYDPTYTANLLQQTGAAELDAISWRWF